MCGVGFSNHQTQSNGIGMCEGAHGIGLVISDAILWDRASMSWRERPSMTKWNALCDGNEWLQHDGKWPGVALSRWQWMAARENQQ